MNRKMRVLLHAMTFKRDFGFVYCLSKVLERMNCEVFVTSNTDYMGLPMRLWNPDVIFFVTHGRMKRLAKVYPNAQLVLWNAESCRLDTDDPVEVEIAANKDDYDRIGKVLLWGKGAKELILTRAKENNWTWVTDDLDTFNEKFVVAGHPRLDLAKYGVVEKAEDDDSINIGLIGLCPGINSNRYCMLQRVLDTTGNEIQDKNRVNDLSFEIKYLDLFARLREKYASEKYKFNIRPYFLENIKNYSRVELVQKGLVEIDDSIDFSSWVKKHDVIIGAVSTTMYVVAAVGKAYINVDDLLERGESLRVFSAAYLSAIKDFCPESFDEVCSMIENYQKHTLTFDASEELAKQKKDYLSPENETPVLIKMAQEIINIGSNNKTDGIKLPHKLASVLNSLRTSYAEFRGLKKVAHLDYSHFDRKKIMPKAEIEFSKTIDDIMDAGNEGNKKA